MLQNNRAFYYLGKASIHSFKISFSDGPIKLAHKDPKSSKLLLSSNFYEESMLGLN
jgi:hypothetical protein